MLLASATNPLLAAALNYTDLGYAVFPCVPDGKEPMTGRGFHDATTDAGQIEAWWNKRPDANIGLATAGLLVIDVDPLSDGAANQWPHIPDWCLQLVAGPTAITPRGGRHHVFRKPIGKPWRCSAGVLAPGVDVRTDGGYIVVAPSRRGDRNYAWLPSSALDLPISSLPEPPPWLADMLDEAGRRRQKSSKRPSVSHRDAPASPEEIPTGTRNTTLAQFAGVMRRGGMSEQEILAALFRINRDRCKPPLDEGEVRQIAASIAGYESSRPITARAPASVGSEELCHESFTVDPGPVPDDLLRAPGFMDEVIRYTLATAPYPEPVMAFCGALALQAVLAARKVRDPMHNRTNVYLLGLANSGIGKEYVRQVNQRILYEAGLAECLGNSFASGEGIEDRLFVQPATLYQVDEIDGLLLRVSQAKDARHEQIVSTLLQMYSSAGSVYTLRSKAGGDRAAIDQPCLSVFGTAVPKQFYAALSPRLLSNGFLARMMVFECSRRGTGRDDGDQPIPGSIVDVARQWAEMRCESSNPRTRCHEPRLVPQTEDARTVFASHRQRFDERYALAESHGDPIGTAIWARAYEKARRLALLWACSANPETPLIDPDAAEWACALSEWLTRRMLFMANSHTSESEFDAKRKRLLEVLSQRSGEHDDQWVPFWKINRRLPWTSREHEEVRATLLEQRLIETRIQQTRGRSGLLYRLLAPRKDLPP